MESTPRLTMPLPTAPAAQSPAPPTTRQSVERPSSLAACGGQLAGHVFRFVARGSRSASSFKRRQQLRSTSLAGPRPSNSVPLASLTSVAYSPVRRRRISSFGSSTLRVRSKCRGSWLRSQRIFGAVKPVRAGIGHHLDQFVAAAGALFDLGAFGRGALVVPEDRAADDPIVVSRNTEPCIWPESPMAFTSAGLEPGLGHHVADRADRGLPPVFRVLLAPERLGA